jgi:hypothetical protein
MADTFARVELHERWVDDKPDYDALHKHMEEAGYVRYMYEGLKRVKLPTGMYRSSSKDGILLLKAKVVFAANRTGHRNEGMVWRGEEMASWGLEVLSTLTVPPAFKPLASVISAKLSDVGKPLPIPGVPVLKMDWESVFKLKK